MFEFTEIFDVRVMFSKALNQSNFHELTQKISADVD